MYCISKILLRTLSSFAVSLILFSCSDGGVQNGSSTSKFSGVQEAIVISPTSIKLTWIKNSSAKEYQILENSSATPLGTTALDYFIIENLKPETSYTFKVIGTSDTSIAGADKELKATTWPRFTGIGSATADALGSIDLAWPYEYSPEKFLIFYRKGSPPDAASTNNWTSVSLETTKKNISISDLDGSSTYYFMVHAQYSEKEKEIATKTLSLTTKTTFATPKYSISNVSIGNVPILTIDPIPDTLHGINFYKTTVLWKGNPVSDPLTGKGQLILHANAGLPLGKVQNLSLKVDYADGNRTESLTIEGLETYIKGMPTNIETPAISSLALGASYLGKVLSKGDFNCDGLDDLAVGLPDVSVADLGVKVSLAGAVIVYYSKETFPGSGILALNTSGVPKINPALGDPQIITFDDLSHHEQFGFSLAAGNFNGDKNGLANCDDLLVGAPFATSTFVSKSSPVETYSYQNGAAYLFFGSSKGLSSSAHISDISSNTSTCDGSLNNAICSPVKLYENQFSIPKSLTGDQLAKSNTPGIVWDQFGSAVTFTGDFNADGFDDIAVGAPHANYDGKISHLSASGSGYLEDVGAVYIFFGSKYGLGFEYPMAMGVPNPTIDAKVRFLKVYAPIPQKGALFGASLAGGADIDGRYKIRSGGSNYYGGGDLVVGSPGFKYENYAVTSYLVKSPYLVGTDPNTHSVLQAPPGNDWWNVNNVPLSNSTNYYGFEQSTSKAVGAAFIYFGRNAGISAPSVDESPTRKDFWKCGKRGMVQEQHYSCLFDSSNVKMLTPRKSANFSTIENFGAAVAVIGSKSRYKENTTALLTVAPPITEQKQYYSDTNEDGYADVVVSAPKSTVSGKTNVGVLHVFYGNIDRLFNPHDFFNLYGDLAPSSDSGNNEVTCTGFNDAAVPTKQLCKPVVLSSASLAAGSLIGETPAQFAVGDVTGDGLLDLAVGAAGDNVIGVGSGAALVFTSVKNGGLSSTYKKIYTVSAGTSDNLGRSVVIGNFNGDKNTDDVAKANTTHPLVEFPYGDLFAGAPNDTVTRFGGGAVYGFYTQNTSLASILSSHTVLVSESLASFSEYGLGETRMVGDINNDGYTDAISKLTSYGQNGGKISEPVIYFGSSIGLITTSFCKVNKDKIFINGSGAADTDCYPAVNPLQNTTLNDIALPQKILKPSNLANLWSFMGVDAGDVNNDGFSDILFIPAYGSSPGYSTLYFGSRTGLLNVVDPSWLPAQGDPQIVSAILIAQYGNGLDTYSANATNNRSPYIAADFNRDGYSDLAFGLPSASSRLMNIGPGSPNPVDIGGAPAPAAGWHCNGSDSSECLGGIAAWHTGSIRILYGSSTGYQTPRKFGSLDDIDRGDAPPTMNMVGTEQAAIGDKPCESSNLATTGGKLDPLCKPTYMDNPVFENINFGYEKLSHLFGQSIAAVDVNHDNYPDLLVSAPGFEDLSCYATNPKSNYGRIYVFYGSEYGLTARDARDYYNANLTGSCPATFVEDNALKNINGGKIRAIMPKVVDYGIADNNKNRQFGFSLATAGDVNLDGYEDFIASSPYEGLAAGTQVGTSYLYYGPLCPADNEDSIGDEFQLATNLNIQFYFRGQLPIGVASTQESNVPLADTSLTSSCFRGVSSKMKPMPQKFYVKSAEAGHQWGLSMVTGKPGKGDFNRDGYDDVIIGSPNYDDLVRGATDIGQGVIFFGSELGLYTDNYPASSVVVTSSGQLRPYAITPVGYTNGTKLFIKMSSSGDINGDGTMDILVPSLNYSGVAPYSGIDLGTFLIFN